MFSVSNQIDKIALIADNLLLIGGQATFVQIPKPATIVRHLCRLLFLSLIILNFSFSTAQAKIYKVIRVYDGDTMAVMMGGQTKSIRLVGIDTPEKSRKKNEPGQPYSQRATKYLAGLVLGKKVSIESYGTDRYGRVLGVVWLGQINVNLEWSRTAMLRFIRASQLRDSIPIPIGKPSNRLRLKI